MNEALARFEALGDTGGVCPALNALGLAARGAGDDDRAMDYFSQALMRSIMAANPECTANALNNIGIVLDEKGRKDEAYTHLQKALQIRQAQGDQRGIAEISTNLGALYFERGQLDEAWAAYMDALRLEQELGHTFGVARLAFNMGEMAENRGGDPEAPSLARRLYLAAECLFDKIGSPYADMARESLRRIRPDLTEAALREEGSPLKEMPLGDLVPWALGAGEESSALPPLASVPRR